MDAKTYLETVTSEDLDLIVAIFGGSQLVADVLGLMCKHQLFHAGEIAALKGMYGVKGLPF